MSIRPPQPFQFLSTKTEMNHDDGRHDVWNDVGHGAFLVAGNHRLDPGSSSTYQIFALLMRGRPRMKKFAMAALATIAFLSPASAQLGDAARGQQGFRACAPCHSLEPDRNMTGPSLAKLWGRKAGGLPSFDRYSNALKSSGIIWDDRALDGWLTDPDRMVPDNDMPFEGIKDAHVRADLLAFLKDATKPGAAPERTAQAQMNGMGGMMGGMMGGGGRDP